METLKFLLTSDTYPPYSNGGDANHVFYLSHELANKGHEVHIISNFNSYSMLAKRFNWKLYKLEKNQNDAGIYNYFLNSPRGDLEPLLTYVFGKSQFYSTEFKEMLNKVKPDVVHHHDITFLGQNLFQKQGNYTELYTAHNYWLICPNRELLRFGKVCEKPSLCSLCLLYSKRLPQVWRWRKSIEEITRDIDIIIAPSEYVKQRLGFNLNKKIVCLPNFIPNLKKEIKPSGYRNFFLYVGQLTERKGIMNILNTFKQHKNEIDANLIIVGSGSLEFKIKDFIKKNGLEKRVLLLGHIDNEQLWSLYNDALALIVPSIWPENNPLVALEAMSVGTPVIGTNSGGLGEIIENVDKNLIFKGDGFEEIRMLSENKNCYSKDRIKNIYHKMYTPEVYLTEYMKKL